LLGPLREILLISLFAAIVLAVIFYANAIRWLETSAAESQAMASRQEPVQRLDYDSDRNSVLVQAWNGQFEEISLGDRGVVKKAMPPHFASFEASETNSTIVMQSLWAEQSQLYESVNIVRGDELLVTEEFLIEVHASADVRISRNGAIALFVRHEGVIVGWGLESTETTRWEYRLKFSPTTTSLSPDGNRLFVASREGTTFVCDSHTGEIQLSLPDIISCSRHATWSSDNRCIAVSNIYGMTLIFDAKTGEIVGQIKNELLFARVLKFSPDGRYLAVGGFDRTIRIWDWAQSDGKPQLLFGSSAQIGSFVFTESGSKLVAGCADGTIREWSLQTNEMTRQIR
jgi:WD40 repeat protein